MRTPAGQSRRRAHAWALVLCAPLVALGCADDVFVCTEHGQCSDDGRDGVCTVIGYCAFADPSCATGLGYGELAPASIAGSCVPVAGDTTTGDDVAATASSGGSGDSGATSQAQGSSASSDPGEPCVRDAPCEPADPCATTGVCDADGSCVAVAFVVCDAPPGQCFAAQGTCTAGQCEYAPLAAAVPCSDLDGCTIDACDGAGTCVPGEACPNDNPCQASSCIDGACAVVDLDDGSSCGPEASARCCGGTCVDISADTAHCGGCNTACAPGLECESLSETSNCEFTPEATSGRCRCQGATAQCPLGQLCRTVDPYIDRCVPPDSSNCDGVRFGQNSCPSFCGYE